MPTDQQSQFGFDAVDERTVKPIVKLLLVLAALLVLGGLLTNLPGVDRLILGTPVSWGAILGAVVTLAIVGVLGQVILEVDPLLSEALPGPTDLVADATSVVKNLLVFLAIVVAHAGLGPMLAPLLAQVDLVWAYDLLFLVLALVPVTVVAYRTFGSLDRVSSLIADRIVDGGGDDASGSGS